MKEDAKDLVIQAQRKLKEVALDFGSEFESRYRRRIDDLCQEILNSLELGNNLALTHSQANLREVLYDLNREVRLQYERDFPDFLPNNK